MIEDASGPCGTEGQVERIYWRAEEPWVRLRRRDGTWLSIPWRQTDLPRLTAAASPPGPRLSPQALLDLVRHCQHRGRASTRVRKPASSR